jgi:hypothetical protein
MVGKCRRNNENKFLLENLNGLDHIKTTGVYEIENIKVYLKEQDSEDVNWVQVVQERLKSTSLVCKFVN